VVPNVLAENILFEGERSDPAKTVAFRAEWHHFENVDHKHAQPHWHVYSIIDRSAEGIASVFGSEPEVKEFKVRILDTNKRFHFAMSSQWHLAKDSHTCQLNFDNVCKWLEGCVSYIHGQFDFIYS
jgi:hypothetical protein